MGSEIVYVELLHEGVRGSRPVTTEVESGDLYRLTGGRPDGEIWAFPPGSTIRCERRQRDLYPIEEAR
jgi:hypothetical protein